MVDVTRKNFEQLLPEIAEKIRNCTFIAIDAEYTGIFSDELKSSNTLFDSASQRYSKARKNVATFCSCQFGLALFRKDRDENVYHAEAYNFYLFPISFDSYAKRDLLTCQLSCLNFLTRHDFDFNKFIKEGIPFLNQEKSESLRKFLRANRHFMSTAEYLDPDYFPEKVPFLNDAEIEDTINRLAGFSKIFDVIMETKKPVVGHNFYTDLLITYHQFMANLPESYVKFKKSINEALPLVYDTKFLAREIHALRRSRKDDDFLLSDSNLFALYTNTNSAFELNMPIVELEGPTESYKPVLLAGRSQNLESLSIAASSCHTAGFDALVTGSVFLNLCYMACRPESVPSHRRGLPPTFSELLGKTEVWNNRINLPRAIIPYLNLSGPDPQPNRPNWILAKSVDGKFIDPLKLKMELIKFGDLEINPLNETEIIIACGAFGCHRRVWGDLKRRGFFLTEKRVQDGSSELFSWRVAKIVLGIGVGGMLAILLLKLLRY